MGPSVERTEELQALVELGLVTILGPEMRVENEKRVNLLLMLICFRKNRYNSHFFKLKRAFPKVNNEKKF